MVTMVAPLFTVPEAWRGGSYDLCLLLRDAEESMLERAVIRAWAHAELDGCYSDPSREPEDQPRLTAAAAHREFDMLRGRARMPNGSWVACFTYVVRDDWGAWLYVGLPLGSLGGAYPIGGYPFASQIEDDTAWEAEVSTWLADLARWVHGAAALEIGLVGCVVSPWEQVEAVRAAGIPEARWVGFVVPSAMAVDWHPPNRGRPFGPAK
jgi:hypothetical protein